MGLLSQIFGKKLKVPEFAPVSIDKQQTAGIDANLKALPKASELARRETKASQDILLESLRAAMPHYDAMVSGGERVIGDMLSGKVPGDVASQIADRAAARGISTGVGALSKFARNLELRDLGLTSLDVTQRGLDAAMSWFKTQRSTATVETMRPSSMFFSPQQRVAHQTSERNLQYQRDTLAAKQVAAPSPVASGLFNTAMFGVGMAGGFGAAYSGISGLLGRNNGAPPSFGTNQNNINVLRSANRASDISGFGYLNQLGLNRGSAAPASRTRPLDDNHWWNINVLSDANR